MDTRNKESKGIRTKEGRCIRLVEQKLGRRGRGKKFTEDGK